jgi:hypothetical protein
MKLTKTNSENANQPEWKKREYIIEYYSESKAFRYINWLVETYKCNDIAEFNAFINNNLSNHVYIVILKISLIDNTKDIWY